MERAERTFVVFLVLATVARAADSADPKVLCQTVPSKLECALMFNNRGGAEFAAGVYPEAELAFANAISLWAGETPRSDDLAKALHNLGAVYRAEGRNSDSASLYQSALDLRELLAGPTDITLLPLLNELGLVYLDLGDVERADHILERARRIAKMHQVEKTIPGADAVNNLAMAYRQQGRMLCAEELFRQALAVYRQTPDAKRTVTALNNLGRTLADEAKLKEAERLYREALSIGEERLGPGHPDVALSYSNLGKLMSARQKYSDAEALLRRAEQIDRENFSATNPRIAYDLFNEAVVVAGRKRYADAEELCEKSEAILVRALPANHPEIGNVLARRADVYRLQGRLDESETLFRRALKILEPAWGPDNPQLLGILRSYESLLRMRQEYAEAESVQVQATKIRVVEALRNRD